MTTTDGRGEGGGLLWLGAALTLVCWALAWSPLALPVSQYTFFPLWLGYVALVNGLAERYFADSLLRRLGPRFSTLFLASVPFWWVFERLNTIVRNWVYVFARPVSDLQYVVEASIDFSTVVPAVTSTVYFVRLAMAERAVAVSGPALRVGRAGLAAMAAGGALCLLTVVLWPTIAFPLVWIAPFLLLEPPLHVLGLPTVLRRAQDGDWSLVAAIVLATTANGFVWELWNFYSSPKWIYTVPYVGFCKIFEMPILGYFGYPFFGLIVFDYAIMVHAALFGREAARDLTP
jgi:hypothetical protein